LAYFAGKSVEELAEEFGLRPETIARKAEQDGWEDLRAAWQKEAELKPKEGPTKKDDEGKGRCSGGREEEVAALTEIHRQLREAHREVSDHLALVQSVLEGSGFPIEGQKEVLALYIDQAEEAVKVAGSWLEVLSREEVIMEKVKKSPPHLLAVTFGILSDQALKRFKEMLQVLNQIQEIIEPPQPVIEIQAASLEGEIASQGLGILLRLIGIEGDHARFVPQQREVTLQGQKVLLPQEIMLRVKEVS
jgi:hypothetical protein